MSRAETISIKVCGMRDHENIRQVAALSPHYLGFIFYPHSPRFVGWDFKMPDDLSPEINRVGVFVNESSKVIVERAQSLGLHYIQLHGNEAVDQCVELKDSGLKIIKVFSVGDDFDFAATASYKAVADYFLFDTRGKYFGGNARTFDWNLLNAYDQEVPFFLSGGLSPENIAEVKNIKDYNLYALDLNSGVEASPGLKDAGKVHAVIKAVSKLS